jgi:hypothetical protein
MSNLKKKENHKKISSRIWNNIHRWAYSGFSLEEFRFNPNVEEVPADPADQIGKQAEQYMKDHADAPETTTAAAEQAATPEPSPVEKIEPIERTEPTPEEAAAYKKEAREATRALREEHEEEYQAVEVPDDTEAKQIVIPDLSVEKPVKLASLMHGFTSLFRKNPAPKSEKQEVADRMREEYERTRGKITIPREEINPRTGTKITVDIMEDNITITIPRK